MGRLWALLLLGVIALVPWTLERLGLPLSVIPPHWAPYAGMFGIGWLCGAAGMLGAVGSLQTADFRNAEFLGGLIIFVAVAVFVFAGVQAGQIKFAAAAVTLLMSGVALAFLSTALRLLAKVVSLFDQGYPIGVESQWGGLGGGMGGWHMSRLAGMVLLTAMLIGGGLGAVVALQGTLTGQEQKNEQKADAKTDAKNEPKSEQKSEQKSGSDAAGDAKTSGTPSPAAASAKPGK
jgi:hypothetical protein